MIDLLFVGDLVKFWEVRWGKGLLNVLVFFFYLEVFCIFGERFCLKKEFIYKR